jgi:hypothetical protein
MTHQLPPIPNKQPRAPSVGTVRTRNQTKIKSGVHSGDSHNVVLERVEERVHDRIVLVNKRMGALDLSLTVRPCNVVLCHPCLIPRDVSEHGAQSAE